jgi:CMP-N-acetylneuraminic acid synthetase
MVTAFVPCRAGSERVKSKNTRPFAGRLGGILEIKIDQLLSCIDINDIIVSTNDTQVVSIVEEKFHRESRVRILPRPDYLCSSSTSTDDLISYVPTIISEGPILWTHVTSPFVAGHHYKNFIDQYLSDIESGEFDSLMSVTEIRTFVWNEQRPINYERSVEKWPRTQTIKPIYEVNSAAFLIDANLMARVGDRIGRRPRLFSLDKKVSFDIDWPDDFELAEMMWLKMANVDYER